MNRSNLMLSRTYQPASQHPSSPGNRVPDFNLLIAARLDKLGFDFSSFTIERFISWLEFKTKRKIFLLGVKARPGMYGAWITDAERPHEYIFYDSSLPPLHQGHTQLHELSHFICQHQTIQVSADDLQAILQAIQIGKMPQCVTRSALLRAPKQNEQEAEAETLAMLIQSRVIQHQRLNELANAVSSNAEAAAFLHGIGLG
jgi:hypothetical protein